MLDSQTTLPKINVFLDTLSDIELLEGLLFTDVRDAVKVKEIRQKFIDGVITRNVFLDEVNVMRERAVTQAKIRGVDASCKQTKRLLEADDCVVVEKKTCALLETKETIATSQRPLDWKERFQKAYGAQTTDIWCAPEHVQELRDGRSPVLVGFLMASALPSAPQYDALFNDILRLSEASIHYRANISAAFWAPLGDMLSENLNNELETLQPWAIEMRRLFMSPDDITKLPNIVDFFEKHKESSSEHTSKTNAFLEALSDDDLLGNCTLLAHDANVEAVAKLHNARYEFINNKITRAKLIEQIDTILKQEEARKNGTHIQTPV